MKSIEGWEQRPVRLPDLFPPATFQTARHAIAIDKANRLLRSFKRFASNGFAKLRRHFPWEGSIR